MKRCSGESSNLVGRVNARKRENCAAVPKAAFLPYRVAERTGPEQGAALDDRSGVHFSEPGNELLPASIRAALEHRRIRRGVPATETVRR
jgi:hypothetical protein